MRRDRQFETILNDCLDNLLAGKETVEQCLQRYPDRARELEPLLRTAWQMSRAVNIEPRPAYRAQARYQMRELVAGSKPRWAFPHPAWQPRWAVAVMSVLLVLVLGGSSVLAAEGSMPGNPLYSIKLVTENVRLRFARSEVEKAELAVAFADRRVAEIDYLVARGDAKPEIVEAVAERFNHHVMMVGALPLDKGKAPPMTEPMMQGAKVGMTESAPTAPPSPAPTLSAPKTSNGAEKAAGEAARAETKDTPELSGDTAEDYAPAIRDILRLKVAIWYYAQHHPEKLREILDRTPERYKPAVRRMISQAVAGYEQSKKNLESR